MKIKRPIRCGAIVLPGEYVIARWDNIQCEETRSHLLVRCDTCGNHYCLMMHWGKHQQCQTQPETREI